MKHKLALLVLLSGFSLNLHAEGIGLVDTAPPAPVDESHDAATDKEVEVVEAPRDCNKFPCRLAGPHSNGMIDHLVVKEELKENSAFYFNSRQCIWFGKGVGVSDKCMQKNAKMCPVNKTLAQFEEFPVPTIIVYRKSRGRHPVNIVSIKTAEHRYYTGPTVTAPFPNDHSRNFLGAYAPCSILKAQVKAAKAKKSKA